MDQELIAYLDRNFGEMSRQISDLREQVSGVRGEVSDVRGEVSDLREQVLGLRGEVSDLREETTRRFSETTQQISDLREETNRQFERIDARFEKVEETARQTLVLVEGLRHEAHLIAEGYLGLNEKLDRYHSEAKLSFNQVKGWIEPYYTDLGTRVAIIERGRDRVHDDVAKAIHKLLGRPPYQPPSASD